MRLSISIFVFLFYVTTIVAQNPSVTSTSELVPIPCNGGVATWLINTDATTTFSYQLQNEFPVNTWNNIGPVTTQTINPNFIISTLFASTYRIILFDVSGNATDTSATFTVNQPPPLINLFSNITNVSCFGLNNGFASLTISGGTPFSAGSAYTYLWSASGQNTQIATGLAPGTYTCLVTDAAGCTLLDSVTITEPLAPLSADPTTKTDVTCFGFDDGTATVVNPSGGTPFSTGNPYTYLWSPGGQTTQTATGLSTGTYTCTVTDANGCTFTTTSVTITEPVQLIADSIIKTDVTCFGFDDGTATVINPSGGVPFSGGSAYTYLWSPGGQTTQTAVGLSPGTYVCAISDANGCSFTPTSVTITEPIGLSADPIIKTDVTCFGFDDGTATVVNPGGGTPFSTGNPYTYLWSPGGQTTQTATGLSPGIYICNTSDSLGCTITDSIIILEPLSSLSTDPIVKTDVTCFGFDDGTATIVNPSGGTPFSVGSAYAYLWSPGGQTAQAATGLSPGTYVCTVSDANGCSFTPISVIITEPSQLNSDSIITTDVTCFGFDDGTATVVNPSGGTPFSTGNLYNYLWSPGGQTTQTASNLSPAIYSAVITDANGCSFTPTSVTITEPIGLSADPIIKTDITCFGFDDGTATVVNPSGGTPFSTGNPYTYLWSPGGQTTQTAIGLSPGTYVCAISDANGCLYLDSVIIIEPPTISISLVPTDLSVFGANDGTITSVVSGGNSGYSYSWQSLNGFSDSSSQVIVGLLPGVYSLNVTDINGCSDSETTVVNQPGCNLIINANYIDPLCYDSLGILNWENTNGVPPYINTLTSGGITYAFNQEYTSPPSSFELPAGVYNLSVTDSVGCNQIWNVALIEPDPLSASVAVTDVICYGDSNGTAIVNLSGGTVPYSINYNVLNPFLNHTQLVAGNYIALVTDTNGCMLDADSSNNISYTINQPSRLFIDSITKTDITCLPGNDGSATVYASGGITPYTFSWSSNPIQFGQTVNLSVGSYSVSVQDLNGCVETFLPVVINQTPLLDIEVDSFSVSCNGAGDGLLIANQVSGSPISNYNWFDVSGSLVSSNDTFYNVSAGIYSVIATDVFGCTDQVSVLLSQPSSISFNMIANDVSASGANDGSINVTNITGSPPFAFLWSGPNGYLSVSQDLINLESGNYVLTVTDDNGCQNSASIFVNEPGCNIVIDLIDLLQPLCWGDSGSIQWINSGGSPPYTNTLTSSNFNLGPFVASSVSEVLPEGSYWLTVNDQFNCSSSLFVQIESPNPMSINPLTSSSECFSVPNGSIDIITNGGTPPYNFIWSNGQTISTLSGLSSGTYSLLSLTDSNNCEALTSPLDFEVTSPSELSVSVSADSESCFGFSDGFATSTVIGGVPPYNFIWNPSGQSTQFANGLSAGINYSLIVTDDNNCTTSTSFNIPAVNSSLTASVVSTNLSCFGSSDGTIIANVSGGTSPYFYLWNDANVQINDTASNLSVGTYQCIINDAKGCLFTTPSVTITQPLELVVNSLPLNMVSCYNSADGDATINIVGGSPPYNYFWNTIPPQNTQTATGLSAGQYFFTVIDSDGCIKQGSTEIIQPISPLNLVSDYSLVSCFGGNDGTAFVNASGGWGSYTYIWNDSIGQTNSVATGLSTGSYIVSVTDDNNCIVKDTITVLEPLQENISVSVSQLICSGDSTGSATFLLSGGTPFTFGQAYLYSWNTNPIQTTQTATNLSSGTYTCTITDSLGCITQDSVTIIEPNDINISLISTDVSVFGANDGTISSTVSGGVAGYNYSWISSNGYSNIGSQNINTLAPGDYTLTVTDANSCTENSNIIINQPSCNLIINTVFQDPLCFDSLGNISWVNINGVPPYFNQLTNSSGTIVYSGFNTDTSILVPADVYNLIVTDFVGCQQIWNVVVSEPDPFLATLSVSDVLCYGDSTGSVNVALSGGTSPYDIDYNFLNPFLNENNLIAGNYILLVSDSNGCAVNGDTTNIINYTISEPDRLNIDSILTTSISCPNLNDGTATAYASGGVFPYFYSWSSNPIQNNQTAINLDTLLYNLKITDANGCIDSATFTISSPGSIVVDISTTATSCNGYSDGSATVNATGGLPPYNYVWSGLGLTTPTISGLNATTTYFVSVIDANGCSLTGVPVNINEPLPISMSFVTLDYNGYDLSCFGSLDAEVTVSASGGISPYQFSYDSLYFTNVPVFSSSTIPVGGIQSGWFSMYVKDFNGCVSRDSVFITEPDIIDPNISILNPLTCSSGNDGALVSVPSGGVGSYTYLWSNLSTLDIIQSLDSGIYSVNVTDANGCSILETYYLNPLISLTLNSTSTNVKCYGAADGTATCFATGGTPPYTYLWSDGQTTQAAVALDTGIYICSVTDSNGCVANDTVNIIQSPTSLVIDSMIILNSLDCFGDNDASLTISVFGGNPPYLYSWDDDSNQTTAVATDLFAGNYSCTIIDSAGCVVIDSVTVSQPSSIDIGFNAIHVSCFGFSDGIISSNITGGTPYSGIFSYGYSWNGPNNFTSNLDSIYDLEHGIYSITISDANNCTETDSIEIIQPPILTYVTEIKNPLCFNDNNGFINLNIFGGTSPYDLIFGSYSNSTYDSITITGLSANFDSLYITDANGCQESIFISLINPLELALDSLNVTHPTCYKYSDGKASFSANGGTLPYSYQFLNENSDIIANSQIINDLSAGVYSALITDANGCLLSTEISIIDPQKIEISKLESCYGSIYIEVLNFVDSYQIFWQNQYDSVYIDNLSPGTYFVTVIDSVQCMQTDSFKVNNPFNYSVYDASCAAESDGYIEIYEINGNAGYPPYSVYINNTLVADDIINEAYINNLFANDYLVSITDNNGCAIVDSIIVIDYLGGFNCVQPPVIISPNSDGNNDTWKPIIDVNEDIYISIYNRWGQIEFSTTSNSMIFEWNGTKNDGSTLPTADYYFVIEFINQSSIDNKTGVITLIR